MDRPSPEAVADAGRLFVVILENLAEREAKERSAALVASERKAS